MTTPLRVRGRVVGMVCMAAVAGAAIWTWFTIDDTADAVLLICADIFASAAAFMAGNAYALRDWRRRAAQAFRCRPAEQRPELPPKATVDRRIRVTTVVALIALGGIVLTGIAGVDIQQWLTPMIAGLVVALGCGVGGSLTPPLDRPVTTPQTS